MAISAKRNARIELKADASGMAPGINDARRKLRTFQREQAAESKKAERAAKAEQKARSKAFRSVRGGVSQGIGMAAGMAGMSAIGDVLGGVRDYERDLVRLQIASGNSAEFMREFSGEVMRASNATGISRKEILGAATAYVTLTGDMATARDQADDFARIAQATGSNVEDIAKAAAAASQNLGITGKDFESMFDTMTGQGKAGAIELKDMAAELSTIAPQWAQFTGGKGLDGARKLGAAMQVVKKGFGGDAGETTVGLQNFLTSLTKKAGRFEGLNFFNEKKGKDGKKTKELKDVFTIIDMISKSKIARDPETLTKAFGSIEAYRAYLQLRDNRAELDKLADSAQYAGTIQRDLDTYMGSTAGRLEKAWAHVQNKMADAFTPERIESFTGAVMKLADALAVVVDAASAVVDALTVDVDKSTNEWADKKKTGLLEGTDKLSDGDKRKRAQQLMREADKLEGMQNPMAVSDRLAKRSAADALMGQTDKWHVGGQGGIDGFKTANALARVAVNPAESAQAVGARASAVGDAVMTQMMGILNVIAENTGKGTAIKIGGEPIQKANANSTWWRKGQH